MPHKRHIMLVEDDDTVRILCRRIIERREGFTVEDYSHGLDAYERLVRLNEEGKQAHYNFILSDIDMPHVDGKEFARKAAILAPRTPVVLMTGANHSDIPANVKYVLHKPFKPQQLLDIIDRYSVRHN